MISYTVRQNTAEVGLYFLMVKSSDHITGLAGLAGSIAVTLSKAGAAFTPAAGAVVDIGKGVYALTPNATDCNMPGPLWLHAEAPGADPCDTLFLVVAYNAYDATALGLAALPGVAAGGAGGLPTADAANGVKLSVGTGTGQLSLAGGKAAATLGAADYATNTPQSGDAFARLGAGGAGLTALAPASTALSTATWTATRAANLDRLDVAVSTRSTYAGADTPGTTSALALLTGLVVAGDHTQFTAHALATAPTSGGTDPWATPLPGSYAAGTAGAILGGRLDVAVSSRSTYAGTDTPGTTSTLSLLTGLVVSADHAQFTAHALALGPTSGGGTDPWDIPLPGSYPAGTAGAILGGRLDVAVSSRSTYAGGDTAGTSTLLARLTDTRATNLDHLDVAVSTRSTYAGGDTPGTTTLLARLTAPRATNLDNLDAAVSTRSTYAGGPVASVVGAVGSVAGDVAGSVNSVAMPVDLDLTQRLAGPRVLDAVADGAINLNDALWAATCGAAGKESVTGTAYAVKTPATGTVLRTFTLDNPSSPTSRT